MKPLDEALDHHFLPAAAAISFARAFEPSPGSFA
jgi:hypothetical protein